MSPRWTRTHAAVLGTTFAAAVAWAQAELLPLAALPLFAVAIWRARGRWTPGGSFGLANAITTGRIVIAAAVALLPAPLLVPWAGIGVLAFFTLDGVDGYVARRTNTASPFGAALDMEADAFMVAVASLAAVEADLVGAWFLSVGALRFAFALLTSAGDHVPEPRRRLARWAFAVLMSGLSAALCVPHPLTTGVLAAGGIAVILSFARSFWWSWQPRQ